MVYEHYKADNLLPELLQGKFDDVMGMSEAMLVVLSTLTSYWKISYERI